jgi:cold shock CspA family protein
MWSQWVCLAIFGITVSVLGEVLVDRQQIEAATAHQLAALLLAFNPSQNGHRQAKLHSPAPIVMQAATTEEAVEKQVEKDLTGRIKGYYPLKGYGFVFNEGVKEQTGKDIVLMKDDFMGPDAFNINDEIMFDMEVGEKLPKAINLRLVARSAASEEAKELADGLTIDTVDGDTAYEEVGSLTNDFTRLKLANYKNYLRRMWNVKDRIRKDVFRVSYSVADLDMDKRSLLVGKNGCNLGWTSEKTGADFIWLDVMGKISVYGREEEQIRAAMSEMLFRMIRLKERDEKKEETVEEKADGVTSWYDSGIRL